MEKALRFEAYRNIGFENEKPKTERLVLSNSLNKGEIGDLVIVIGPNNAGKSNVLNGLVSYGASRLEKRDVTDLFINENCKQPSLTLSYKTDNGDEYSLCKEYGQSSCKIHYPKLRNDESISLTYTTKETLVNDIQQLCNFEKSIGKDCFSSITKRFCLSELSDEDFERVVKEVFEQLETIPKPASPAMSNVQASFVVHKRNQFPVSLSIYKDFVQNRDHKNDIKILEDSFHNKYGYEFSSKVYKYQEEKVSNNNLNCEYESLSNSRFFKELFSAIGIELSTVVNTYNLFREQNNRGHLQQLQDKLNLEMKRVSDKFNQLYYLKDLPYSFNLALETTGIWFSIFRGGQALSLDYQSDGFKWFFNLYFGLLNSNNLNPGDIIVMDEPATNLHPQGQKQLRAFLKEFAISNDIIIVIATHSPFLIDIDYLDELRIVVNKNNITSIINNFAAVNPDDPDSLLPIKESLTVDNHVICNPDQNVVFVEGITDYNYLVAFKKILKREELTFLPINGLGNNKESNEKISKRLLEIRRHNPRLLVDNDKAGQSMEKVNANDSELEVISLGDVDPNFKTIESLFSPEDLKNFGLVDNKGNFIKHASTSTLFKNQVLKNIDSISEETKKNFEKLFERLCN